ncbi:histidine kinase dimerization/phosphoacceptor domain-containing protein [Nonomuraea dietziae]|uniref:histidine kinase dimerization/phosphoacceptor domain-containing protein n=1 Tax=Nonomuraea dietziae TaxID=65515 RepID=UPI0031DF3799
MHDVLGHDLSVIALKAELAERLVSLAPDKAAQEAADLRRVAADALTNLRAAVHGYREVDLAAQLTAVAQVLRSSGVRCTVTGPDRELPREGRRPARHGAAGGHHQHPQAQYGRLVRDRDQRHQDDRDQRRRRAGRPRPPQLGPARPA